MKISKALFAHIHNDAHIKGTVNLEGQDFNDTISFLLEYAEQCKLGNTTFSDIEHIRIMLDKLTYLRDQSETIRELHAKFKGQSLEHSDLNGSLNQYGVELLEKTNLLDQDSEKNSILIPGGWSAHKGGHAMVYEFQKDQNGDVLFIVHNTGAGLNYHQKQQQLDKERYCPIQVYRIPSEAMQNSEGLTWFIGELIKPQLQLKDDKYTEKRLYEEQFTKLYLFNAKLEDSFKYTKQDSFIAGQLSGTCTEKVLHQMVQSSFSDKKTYKQFIYGLKKYSLEKFTSNLQAQDLQDKPWIRNQVTLAIENMARLLLKSDYFDIEQRNSEKEYLEQVYARYKKINLRNTIPAVEINSQDISTNIALQVPSIVAKIEDPSVSLTELESLKNVAKKAPFDFSNFSIQSIKDFVGSINLLIKDDQESAIASIERFLINWPLEAPEAFKHELKNGTNEEIKDLFSMLGALHTRYATLHNNNKSPQFVIAELSFVAIIAKVVDCTSIVQGEGLFTDLLKAYMDEILAKHDINPYLTTGEFRYDNRLNTLVQGFSITRKFRYIGVLQKESIHKFYLGIINKYDSLSDMLTKYLEQELKHNIGANKYRQIEHAQLENLYVIEECILRNQEKYDIFLGKFCAINATEIETTKEMLKQLKKDFAVQEDAENLLADIWSKIGTKFNCGKFTMVKSEERYPEIDSKIRQIFSSKLKSPLILRCSEDHIVKATLDLSNNFTSVGHITVNEIQVGDQLPEVYRNHKNTPLMKELAHLRTSIFQIEATVDFFTEHRELLSDINYQTYFTINLFQPPLLIKHADNDDGVIEKLKNFIHSNIQLYTIGTMPNLVGLFFMELDLKLAIYFNQAENSTVYLQEVLEKINVLIEHVDETDNPRKAALHYQRILVLSELDKTNGILGDINVLEMYLESLLIHTYSHEPVDIENLIDVKIKHDAFRLVNYCLAQLNDNVQDDLLTKVANKVLATIPEYKKLIEQTNVKIEIKKPYIHLINAEGNNAEICRINIQSGSIVKPGFNQEPIPGWVLQSEKFSKIFGSFKPIALANDSKNSFEFVFNDTQYRIIIQDEKYSICCKYVVLNEEAKWYEMHDAGELNGLPEILKAENNVAWVEMANVDDYSSKEKQVLINNIHEPSISYLYNSVTEQMITLDENLQDTGFVILPNNSELHKIVENFEDPKFVLAMQKGNGYKVELPRYTMSLKVTPGGEVFLGDTLYKLDLSEKIEFIPGLYSPLVFRAEDDNREKVLIPVQQFTLADAQPTELTEYYEFEHDTHNKVKQKIFNYNAKFAEYKGTESFIEYASINGDLVPNNMEDGLYLAFLYLRKAAPEEALKTLTYIENNFGSLTGTDKEIDYINWIVFNIPTVFAANLKDAEIETPEFTSVRLKALAMLAEFKRDNPGFKVAKYDHVINSNNDKYNQIASDYRRTFYSDLNQNIDLLYKRYHQIENNVPISFRLTLQDQLVLLRSMYVLEGEAPVGPMGLYWRKLEFNNLKNQLNLLKKQALQYKFIPANLAESINFLEGKIKKTKKVLMYSSKIAEQEISISSPSSIKWNFKNSSYKNADEILNSMVSTFATSQRERRSEKTRDILSVPIDEKLFVSHFLHLLKVVYDKNEDKEEDVALLKDFCQRVILSSKNLWQGTNVSELCRILYQLALNVDEVRSQVKIGKNIDYKLKNFFENGKVDSYNINFCFEQTLQLIATQKASKITVPNRINIIEDYTVTSNDALILANLRPNLHPNVSTITNAAKIEKLDLAKFTSKHIENELPELKDFFVGWAGIEAEYQAALNAKIEKFKQTDSIVAFSDKYDAQSVIDIEVGEITASMQQAQQQLILEQIGEPSVVKKIYAFSKENAAIINQQCKDLYDNHIVKLANKNFNDPILDDELSTNLHLNVLAKKINKIQFNDLLRLYLKFDINQYMEETKLPYDECIELHNKIATYLQLSCQAKKYTQICDQITKDNTALEKIAELITMQDLVDDYVNSTVIGLFQYDQGKFVRPKQQACIDGFLEKNPFTDGYKDKITQLIMGGGKSTVILVILALKRAAGSNLSIIEVPQELFKSNLADLTKVSMQLFGQRPYGFYFDRNTPHSAKQLKMLYRHFSQVMTSANYIVSTRESMASIQLKLHELLLSKKANDETEEERAKQIKWLSRIINLIKDSGDLLCDEVDANFDIKKQINYTVGDSESIIEKHYTGVLDLYEFCSRIPLNGKVVLDYLLTPDLLSDEVMTKIKELIAEHIVDAEHSPLAAILLELTGEQKKDVLNYLLDISDNLPQELYHAYELNHIKDQISHLLPHTAKLKLYTNYGPSRDNKKNILDRVITVPYTGNMDPKELSKDKVHFKTINLTIQHLLIAGVSEELFKAILDECIDNAKYDLMLNPSLKNLDNTATGISLNAIFKKIGLEIKLSNINLEDKQQLDTIHANIAQNRDFIFYILRNEVLKRIKVDKKVILHDAYDHFSLYRSVTGMTGTPWNWRTMHQNMSFDELFSLGTDGLTIAYLRAKNTSVDVLAYESVEQFLEKTITDKVWAIIDVGATFSGVENRDVANKLSDFYKGKKQVKYILYYDKDNTTNMDELYAIAAGEENAKPIALKGKDSKEILKTLNCTLKECFTYYDQKHTRGADVTQDPEAIAIVTVDHSTLLNDLLQGVMRLRDFSGKQQAKIVISPDTEKTIKNMLGLTMVDVDSIIEYVKQKQKNKLLEYHFTSTLDKMQHIVKQNLYAKISAVDSKDTKEKIRLQKIFKQYFLQSMPDNMFEQHIGLQSLANTEDVFKKQISKLLGAWEVLLQNNEIEILPGEKTKISSELNAIMAQGVKICKKQYLKDASNELEQFTEAEQESFAQKDNERQQYTDVETLYSEKYDEATLMYEWIQRVKIEEIFDFESTVYKYTQKSYDTSARRETYALHFDGKNDPFEFSADIFASFNVIKNDRFDKPRFQKPAHALLMVQTETGLRTIAITYTDAQDVKKRLESSADQIQPHNYLWVMNTRGTILCGSQPAEVHPDFTSHLRQLQFYNGDFDLLLTNDILDTWIMDDSNSKLKYFEKNVLPYRYIKKKDFYNFKKKVSDLQELLSEITAGKIVTLRGTINIPLSQADKTTLGDLLLFYRAIDKSKNVIGLESKFLNWQYFAIFIQHANDKILSKYLSLFDVDHLAVVADRIFENAKINHNYALIIKIISNKEILSAEKRTMFLEKLTKNLDNVDFYHKFIKESKEDFLAVMHNLDKDEARSIFKSINEGLFSWIINADLSFLKEFLQNIEPEDFVGKLYGISVHNCLQEDFFNFFKEKAGDYFLKHIFLNNSRLINDLVSTESNPSMLSADNFAHIMRLVAQNFFNISTMPDDNTELQPNNLYLQLDAKKDQVMYKFLDPDTQAIIEGKLDMDPYERYNSDKLPYLGYKITADEFATAIQRSAFQQKLVEMLLRDAKLRENIITPANKEEFIRDALTEHHENVEYIRIIEEILQVPKVVWLAQEEPSPMIFSNPKTRSMTTRLKQGEEQKSTTTNNPKPTPKDRV